MKRKLIKAFALQVAITAGIVGLFFCMGCVEIGQLIAVGYFCASSENLSKAFGNEDR